MAIPNESLKDPPENLFEDGSRVQIELGAIIDLEDRTHSKPKFQYSCCETTGAPV